MKTETQTQTEAAPARARQFLATILLASLLTAPPTHAALQYQRLKSFGDASLAGRTPVGRLLEGSDGALYGTTAYSFSHADFGGVVFRVNKDGADYRVLHRFGSSGDGSGLFAAVIEGSGNQIFGTAYNGGSNGVGVIFRMRRDGTGYSILRHFRTNDDGGQSPGGLVLSSDGMLYGTTRAGGSHTNAAGEGLGTVYKVNPDGSAFTVLHQFGSVADDGANPVAALIEGGDGRLYGTTEFGGSHSAGTVFSLDKAGGSYSILCHLGASSTDGSRPKASLLEGSDGVLYGTTVYTGTSFTRPLGTVFKLNRDGSGYSTLHPFIGAEGRGMYWALIEAENGMLYGTTFGGGNGLAGTVFRLNKDGSNFGVVHHFTGSPDDGDGPQAGVILCTDGNLYGATERGGVNVDAATSIGAGTLYRLNPDGGDYEVVRDFTADFSGEGLTPNRLLDGSDGNLYGTTEQGGTNSGGTVFRVHRDGSGFTVLHHFDVNFSDPLDPTAESPNDALIEGSDGALYGTTRNGGLHGAGSVFRVNRDGTGYTVLHHFQFSGPISLEGPSAGLVEGSDGSLYGTTWGGGVFKDEFGYGAGTVFKLSKDGTGFSILHDFNTNGVAGRRPTAELIEGSDGALYGTTFGGGGNDAGVVFKLNKDGGNFTALHEFGSNDNGHGFAALVEGTDGALYGTSYQGGVFDGGFVFKLNKDGTGYDNLHSFGDSAEDGLDPESNLVEGSDGALYGTTYRGGLHTNQWGETSGTVFSLNKDGSGYGVLHHLGGAADDGRLPLAGLIQGRDGALYGTTSEGGALGFGTLFRLSWPLVITRYERSGGNALLDWSGVPNWPYRIQTRTNLTEAADAWVYLGGTNFTTVDGTASVTNAEPQTDPARFYRIAAP